MMFGYNDMIDEELELKSNRGRIYIYIYIRIMSCGEG